MLGFVDVPGHEKLIHNMLAGATGIDYVLLAIAAADGPMPQTTEHLQILDLLVWCLSNSYAQICSIRFRAATILRRMSSPLAFQT
jgi:hypothetical protein